MVHKDMLMARVRCVNDPPHVRQHRYDAELDLDVHDASTRTSFAVVNSYASAVKWMPGIVNFNFLPDMGRMTA